MMNQNFWFRHISQLQVDIYDKRYLISYAQNQQHYRYLHTPEQPRKAMSHCWFILLKHSELKKVNMLPTLSSKNNFY